MRHTVSLLLLFTALAAPATAQRLFVGLEGSTPPTKSSDLQGFPNVTWTNHYAFDVSGAAATPEGTLYVCNGAFTTGLYRLPLNGPAQYLCTASVDIQGMGYGNGTLYGFSNFASPRGIYSIDPATGQTTLVVDLEASGFRFFALDFNTVDGLLYGYTEYGSPTGLYSINPTTGATTFVTGPIPAANTQGRGLAVGNNTVYLTATRGDDHIPLYAFDLAAGTQWVGFTNPYPLDHATGGATWLPPPAGGVPGGMGTLNPGPELWATSPARSGSHIDWRIRSGGPVLLEVLDLAGRSTIRLEDGIREAGLHRSQWGGTGSDGRPVPNGVYFLRLVAGGAVRSQPLLLIR